MKMQEKKKRKKRLRTYVCRLCALRSQIICVHACICKRINMYEHKSARKMIGPLSCIYYNNANASRIYKIYHFLLLLSFVLELVLFYGGKNRFVFEWAQTFSSSKMTRKRQPNRTTFNPFQAGTIFFFFEFSDENSFST